VPRSKPLNEAISRPFVETPVIKHIVANAKEHSVFTVIDLKQGSWHCELDLESSKACAFSTPYGVYRFLRLPYGIKSAPKIFQAAITNVFAGIPGVQAYYDDLLISAESYDDHDVIFQKVTERAKECNVKFNLGKLQYRKTSVTYIGHTLAAGQKAISPDRLAAIRLLPSPTKQNRSAKNHWNVQLCQGIYSQPSRPFERIQPLTEIER